MVDTLYIAQNLSSAFGPNRVPVVVSLSLTVRPNVCSTHITVIGVSNSIKVNSNIIFNRIRASEAFERGGYPQVLPQFAALSGTSKPQLLPSQNGAIVRTDSVRTKAYLQNSETCMRNLHW